MTDTPELDKARRQHRALLVRIECDTSLTDDEVMDTINFHLDTLRSDMELSEGGPLVDVSATTFTLAVDVTPPGGIDGERAGR